MSPRKEELKFSWVAVPAGANEGLSTIRVSVVVTPHAPLEQGADTLDLAGSVLSNWPAVVKKNLSFDFAFEKNGVTVFSPLNQPIAGKENLRPQVWKFIFGQDLSKRQHRHQYQDDPQVPIRTYPVKAVSDSVKNTMNQFIAHFFKWGPFDVSRETLKSSFELYDLFAELQWEAVGEQEKEKSKELFKKIETALEKGDKDKISEYMSVAAAGNSEEVRAILSELNVDRIAHRDFYRLSADPRYLKADVLAFVKSLGRSQMAADKTARPHPGMDKRSVVRGEDFIKHALYFSRIPNAHALTREASEETKDFDFFEKLALIGNHLPLLRPLGLVLDVDLEIGAGILKDIIGQGLLSVKPVWNSLEGPQPTNVPTKTHYVLEHDINALSFRAMDTPAHWVKNGYLDLEYKSAGAAHDKYYLETLESDGAASKLISFSTSLNRVMSRAILTDINGTIIAAGGEAQRLGGNGKIGESSNNELIGKPVLDYIAEEENKHCRQWITDQCFNKALPVKAGLFHLRRGDGKTSADRMKVLAVPIMQQDGNAHGGFLLLMGDVDSQEVTDVAKPPALRSGGITLVNTGKQEEVLLLEARGKEIQEQISKGIPPEFYASDLVLGYIPEVEMEHPRSNWHSLCSRTETYEGFPEEIKVEPFTQGFIRDDTAAQSTDILDRHGKNRDLGPKDDYVSSHIFRWEGLCLSAQSEDSQTFRSETLPVTGGIKPAPEYTGFRVRVAPASGCQPPLRFSKPGQFYNIRVKVVDRAGQIGPGDNMHTEFSALRTEYLRYEPVGAPEILLDRPLEAEKDRGSGLYRMVVRDGLHSDARHAVPPRISQDLAVLHGVFDKKGVPELRDEEIDSIGGFEEVKLNSDGSFPTVLSNASNGTKKTYDPIYLVPDGNDSADCFYYPDPLALGIRYTLIPYLSDASRVNPIQGELQLYANGFPWPKARHVKVILKPLGKTKTQPEIEPSNLTLTIWLPWAWRGTLRLSSSLGGKENLAWFALWKNYQKQLKANELEQFEHKGGVGDNPLLTPHRDIQLVHSVSTPPTPSLEKLIMLQSAYSSEAKVELSTSIDVKSTGKMELLATITTTIDNPFEEGPRNITDEDFVKEFIVPCEIGTSYYANRYVPDAFIQLFQDTKYRKISYFVRAISRFRDDFPKVSNLHFTSISQTPFPIEMLSTAPPVTPVIKYMVPTLSWSTRTDEFEIEPNKRFWSLRSGGIRIYLSRPWYSSGSGEMLGIVLWPDSGDVSCGQPTEPPMETDGPASVMPYVSRWGTDPVQNTTGITKSLLSAKNFEGFSKCVASVHLQEPDTWAMISADKKALYKIPEAEGAPQIVVDQTTVEPGWVDLGVHKFVGELDISASVKLTSSGTMGSFTIADAVRFEFVRHIKSNGTSFSWKGSAVDNTGGEEAFKKEGSWIEAQLPEAQGGTAVISHQAGSTVTWSTKLPIPGAYKVEARIPAVIDKPKVALIAYDPTYDEQKQCWYCDLSFKEIGSYRPFVKLALVRYQANSLKGMEMSKVIQADFAQLVPGRAVSVMRDPSDRSGLSLVVQIVGVPSYARNASQGRPHRVLQNTFRVEVFRQCYHSSEDEIGWVPDADIEVIPINGVDDVLWAGVVKAKEKMGARKLVIREHEQFFADKTDKESPETFDEVAERLIYCDTLEL